VNSRLDPRLTSAQYAVRRPLLEWLRDRDVSGLRVLDVGCGDRPYQPLFTAAAEVVGLDVPGNPHADIVGSIETIPVEDASFDLVVCLQVIEHVPDPAAAVRELRRIVRPGGQLLLSTHGVAPFHPNPEDHWRWTATGLQTLFAANGPWTLVTVTPGAGTAATTAMLVAHAVDLLFKRVRLRPLAQPVVALLNVTGEALDRAVPLLRSTAPGTLHANYHVEATA
jgi:SAM-dependent methyltransferase